MRGQILEVQASGGGTILGADGDRYGFARSDWRGPAEPTAGADVDFVANSGRAADIFPLPGQSRASGASFSPAAATAGPTAGRSSEGSSVALGTIGIVCLALGFVVPVIPTVAAFVLGLVGAESAKRHGNESGLVLSRIAWIGALVLTVLGIFIVVMLAIFAWPLMELMMNYVFWAANNPPNATAAL